jgi:cellulose synthase/poly-beta-1,6-N-acetylglucosamine synthase-like glycosyltransferase
LKLSISACIPALNNFDTLESVLTSIKNQTHSIEQIFVFDDGSRTSLSEMCQTFGVNFKRFKLSKGRGFIRNHSIEESTTDLVLFCDASNKLSPSFVKEAIPHFATPAVAAVSGMIANDTTMVDTVSNWRSRHLFKSQFDFGTAPQEAPSLTTYGTILRKSAVLKVGNFNPNLTHSEDKELGTRLIKNGYKIIGDPNLVVYSIKKDTVFSVLERYWRWYGGIEEKMTFKEYLHAIKASIKPMMQQDLMNEDWKSAFISILCPHYGYARAKFREFSGKAQKE